ncbi:MAG: hypothetical protein WKI04_10610 [Ferruginibacter sp.]
MNNQNTLEALQVLAVIYRMLKDKAKATRILNKINEIDQLSHFARFEKFLWDGSGKSKEQFLSPVKNEMPQQTFLELGIWYQQLNCKQEALQVLGFGASEPEFIYWRSFLENKAVELDSIQPGITFPFRSETARVLEGLIKKNDHWLLKYHRGLIEWNRNNLAKAKLLFVQCGSHPADPAFYAARAALIKSDAGPELADLQKAMELDKTGWRYHKLLAEHFVQKKQYQKALAIVEPYYKTHPDDYVMGMLFAKTLLLSKKYTSSDALLSNLKILPFEGGTEGRQLYHEAKLMQAVIALKNKIIIRRGNLLPG